MQLLKRILITCILGIAVHTLNAQATQKKLADNISKKFDHLNDQIDKKSERLLKKMQAREDRIRRRLAKIDSVAAKDFFNGVNDRYSQLSRKLKDRTTKLPISGQYLPYLDSLKTGMAFLSSDTSAFSIAKFSPVLAGKALDKIKLFENNLQKAESIKQFIRQRKQQLSNLFKRYTKLPAGIARNVKKLNKQAYYYSAQIKEYKEMFRNPEKIQEKALALLNKVPAFQEFMKKNSTLAAMFNIPGSTNNIDASQAVAGLQPRSQVLNFLQTQSGGNLSNVNSLVKKSVQSAQGQVDQLRNKLNGYSGDDLDMPGFKPNNQRTKSFLQRLELGTNLQTAKGNSFFPITTDVALSLGYKLNDKNIIGIGASYKVGWGKDIRHIRVSSEGTGIRSFIDVNIRRSFFVSGGFEYNYQEPFSSMSIYKNIDSWQKSGLIGISKIVSLNTKFLKKTKIQLLWDFLSYQQRPQAQALKFRIGYSF